MAPSWVMYLPFALFSMILESRHVQASLIIIEDRLSS